MEQKTAAENRPEKVPPLAVDEERARAERPRNTERSSARLPNESREGGLVLESPLKTEGGRITAVTLSVYQ